MIKGIELWNKFDRTVKVLLIIVVVLALFNWVELWIIAKLAFNRNITITFPSGTYENTSVVAGNNKGYIELWGRHFIDVISEYSPQNFEAKANYLLRYTSSKGDKNLRPKLLSILDEVKKTNAYQEFHPDEATWKVTWLTRELWRVEVEGDVAREVSVSGQSVKNKQRRLYYVDIKYSKDGIQLEDFGYVEK
ncbi:TraE/TraK family type IV conjugative transfer system protein [Thermodesulfovibrio sp. TK110]